MGFGEMTILRMFANETQTQRRLGILIQTVIQTVI